ncbi:MAG TPA: FAD-binding protein, partial [Gammaproteobacteria bacterium]|nr:FAD-binding protein [Gammaproteobacteria bacterium]
MQTEHRELDDIPESRISKQALVERLQEILPENAVLHEVEDLHPYECDGLSAYRRIPMIVVLPTSVEQVQKIVKLCHQFSVPIVARGAGTGLSGGALPLEKGLLLSLAKFKSILELNARSRTARVQPGVRNLAISEAAKPHGLYYAPDPSSQIACS